MILCPPVLHQPVQTPPPAETQPVPASLKAEYKWSFRKAGESGSGTLALALEPASGKLVLEVFSYGERLALVDGDTASGYQLVLPKEQVNRTVPALADLPLPFLPQAGSVEALAKALATGEGPDLTVDQRDGQGPVRLRFASCDEAGQRLEVRLTRKRWEASGEAAPAAASR